MRFLPPYIIFVNNKGNKKQRNLVGYHADHMIKMNDTSNGANKLGQPIEFNEKNIV